MLSTHFKLSTTLKLGFLLILVGIATVAGNAIHPRLRSKVVRVGGPIPYSVILRETLVGPDGTAKVGMEMTQAVRSDGSVVWRMAQTIGGKAERMFRFASGIYVTTDEIANTKSTTLRRNVNPARWQRDPSSKCINSLSGEPFVGSPPEVISEEEMVAGYRAVKITRNNATRWFALDHGCAMIKERMDWGSKGISEKNLVALVPGEPDTALFEVPTASIEVPPSVRLLGPDSASRNLDRQRDGVLRKLDDDYNSNRPTTKSQ